MAKFSTKFDSTRQDWETPDSIFKPLDDEFHFTLDVCATKQNRKCRKFFCQKDDGLAQDWTGEICWMNPPFAKHSSIDCLIFMALL